MTEWSNVVAWKAAVVNATAGSNPVLSASEIPYETAHMHVSCFLYMQINK